MTGKPPHDVSRLSRELLLELVEHIPTAAVVVDGDRLYCNRATENLTGYSRREVASFTEWLRKLFGPDHTAMREHFEKDKADGFPVPREFMITCRDGSCRIVEFSATGREQVFCVMHDLTERIRAEQTIRDNETFLREAQRIGNLGIYEYDIENDRWTSSRELDRIFGIEATFQK
ncbi:MAG TPA: PAS domain S-box protein, partial [Geobacteraceae bacterium]|nr:PAS domain S-box protein [Geobacteraceae bacterium]